MCDFLHIYRLNLYQSIIAKAIYYNWTLDKFRNAAVVLGIDKSRNLLKSIDFVRSYTSYDTAENDVLPLKSKEIKIYHTTTPKADGNNLKMVLGLNWWTVVGLRIYPLDKNLLIPRASKYKIMEVVWYSKCDSSINNYNSSLYYGLANIWIWKDTNLSPSGTRWVKFNYENSCYVTFENGFSWF